MKASMVSRNPSGSITAAAAISPTSTLAPCTAPFAVGMTAVAAKSRLRAVSIRTPTLSAAPIKLSQNGKKPGPGPKASLSE